MGKRWINLSLGIALILFLGDIPRVSAQDTDTEEFTLEEITVTAQKREENQQKVAIPMDVISGDQLAETGKMNVDDILLGLSNVMINYAQDGMRVSVRGLTDTDGLFQDIRTSTPTVAVNLDGAYNSSGSAGQNLFDIERVEVLYGPQSTMYASNSPGGIVNVVTAAPKTDKYSASASLEYGNYKLFTGQAMLNTPIIREKLAMRLAVQMQKRDSYVSGDRAGTEQIGEDTKSARLKTLYQPNNDFSATITVNWAKKINAGMMGGSVQYFDTPDGYWYTGGGFPPSYANSGIKVKDPWTASFLGGALPPIGLPLGPNTATQYTKAITGDIKLNTGIGTLLILPSYNKNTSDDRGQVNNTDFFGNIISTSMAYTNMEGTQKGVEVRLTSKDDFLFKWIFGVNYYSSKNGRYTTYSNPDWDPNTLYVTEKVKAVFGNITYPFTEKFRGTAGYRYSSDEMFHIGGGFSGMKIPAYKSPDYKLGVEYDLAENSMLFANYATSYRVNAFRTNLPPEKDKTYTIGVKNRFFDNKLQLNSSAYWYDYKNVQVLVSGTSTRAGANESQLADPDGNPVDLDSNGIAGEDKIVYDNSSIGLGIPGQITDPWDQFQTGAYRTIGADVSLDWIITGKDRLNLTVTYLNAEWSDCKIDLYYKSASGDTFWPVDGMDYSGITKSYSPKWTSNLGFEHNFVLGAFGTLVPHIDLMYKTHYVMGFQQSEYPVSYQEAYYMVNGNVTINHASGKWTLNAYVKNATNYAAKTFIAVGPGGMTIGDPRTYGAVLSIRFSSLVL